MLYLLDARHEVEERLLREWVDDPAATPADLDALTLADEAAWEAERKDFLLY